MDTDLESQVPEANGIKNELDNHAEQVKVSEDVTRALLARPKVSLRVQVLFGFLLVFIVALLITAAIVVPIYQIESKLAFLETVNDYVMEVDQARRFEKNFFLYNTNLHDALDSVYKTKEILKGSREEFISIIGKMQWRQLFKNIEAYEQKLEEIVEFDRVRTSTRSGDARSKELGLEVRKRGQRMVFLAQDLMKKEKRDIESAVDRSAKIQMYSLAFLLVFMITTAYLISGNILQSIVRYESYTQRIADGDFTPITPARRYRDEFTNLALAINNMMLELKKHEAMLVQTHKMKAIGTLTAGVAHELNNPLNNITITSHMYLEDFTELDDDEKKDMINDVVKEADRAKKIVSNLLDFTRESETRLEPLDLADLVQGTIALASNQSKIAGIKVELTKIDNLPRILGDTQQLMQVFLNLILNAIAASNRGGKIQVMVQPADEPNRLSVKVVDHGSGISEENLTRVFDPFFTTKEKGKGTGLGLSVSQGIVAKHGGRMMLDSREGEGSTFTVILPVIMIS